MSQLYRASRLAFGFALLISAFGHTSDHALLRMRRRREPHPNLLALLEACSEAAERAVPVAERANLFASQGNIHDVRDEVSFYGAAALLPGVKLIGEIGFNAGHSTVTFLFQKPDLKVVSFDLGVLRWSSISYAFVKRLYPGRLEIINGYSTDTVPKYVGPKFDLFAVDGAHDGETPYLDMKNGRAVTRPGGYILIDDYTATNIAVKRAWKRAIDEDWIREILCVDDGTVVHGAQKAYCLGTYV
jgi:predicted O-methyltransferase YrrM